MAGFSTELLQIPGSEINMPSTSRNTSGSRRNSPGSNLRYRPSSPNNSTSHVGGAPYQETTLVDEHLTTTDSDSTGRTNSPQTPLVRRVTLKHSRHSDDDIGVGLSGGKENGQGIFVSSVKKGSGADRSGLAVGDQVLAINNISLLDFTLQETINILYSTTRKIQLTVIPSRRQENSHNADLLHYLWVDSERRPVSPPVDLAYESSHHRGIEGRDSGVRTVTLNVEKGLPLGLLIRGGMEDGLGIFVTGVDNPSAADLAGLQVGDQILSVNDKSFKSIRHDEAVDILKFSPRMTMTVRYVGKIPHACTPYSGQSWYEEHQQLSSPRLSRRGSSRKREKSRDLEAISTSPTEEAEKILYHRAQQVLTESEKICLAYYCNEYETRAMTVDAFVAILMELLVNPEKYLLMTHIRGIVRREDLKKFDDLIYKCEIQTIKSKEVVKQATEQSENSQTLLISPSKEAHSPRGSFRKQKNSHHHRLTVPDHLAPHKVGPPAENSGASSQDSDVDVAGGNRSIYGMSNSARSAHGSRLQVSDNHSKSDPWKSSRILPRRSIKRDIKGTSPATLLRRLTLRRHSSGGEGVNPEERRVSSRVTEERRWSLGSELLETHEDSKPESRPVSSVQRERKSSNLPSFNGTQEKFSNWLQVPHTRVRRHRSLPDPHAICARKHQQPQLPLHQHRSASMRLPGHRATPEPNGRLRIVIKKTRPLLGIAIEGGVNTGQPLPRIISIHASGAAFEAGGLKVGHIILEVNGFKTSKMEHQQVAQLIAESFYNSDSDQLELLVMEKAKTELEIRRSSFMILE